VCAHARAGRPFGARELQHCDSWQDLSDIFRSGLLDTGYGSLSAGSQSAALLRPYEPPRLGEGQGKGAEEKGSAVVGMSSSAVVGMSSAVLGMSINYASNGECWHGSAVDWVVWGVQVAAARALLR
jgi:hypothetical protein